MSELMTTDSQSPRHSLIVKNIAPIRRVTKTPLQTPNFKWKTKGSFRPKIHIFDSSKVILNPLIIYDNIMNIMS